MMLNDLYVHERLARAASNPSKHEIARQLARAELSQRPGLARRTARASGRLLIRLGAWLVAYGAGREGRLRQRDLRPRTAATTFSQH